MGVYLGLPLFVICSSGTLAVLGYEWDWLLDPARRAPAGEVDWAAVDRALEAEASELRLGLLRAPRLPGYAVRATGLAPSGQIQDVLLAPDGEVLGRRSFLSVQMYLRNFHRNFLIPLGIFLVTLLSVPLLLSAATGLLVQKGIWRQAVRLRVGRGIRVLVADAHRALGFWSLALALMIAGTGIWYFAEALAHRAFHASVEPEPPTLSEARLDSLGPNPERLPLGVLVDRAVAAMPDMTVRAVMVPQDADDPIRIDGQTDAWLVRDRASRVYLDPYSGAVLGTQRATETSIAHRWSDTADPLHFGDFGGLLTKMLWFALGLLLSLAVLAGPALAELRRRHRSLRAPADAPRFVRTSVLTAAGLAGLFVLAALVVTATAGDQPALAGRRPPTSVAGPLAVGPWRLAAEARPASGGEIKVRLHPLGPGVPQWASLHLRVGEDAPIEVEDLSARVFALDEVTLEIEDRSGERFSASLAFAPAGSAAAQAGLREVGLDRAPVPHATYVFAFIAALLVFELAGILLWLALAWRASGGAGPRTPALRRSAA